MLKKNKQICIFIFVIMMMAGIVARIVWVNRHARIPENKIYAMGESLYKDGFTYTIQDAVLYYPSDFEKVYTNGSKYIAGRSDDNLRVMVVKIKLELDGDSNSRFSTPDNYLEAEDVLCMVDNDNFGGFNPSLSEGNFRSGDLLNYVFPIYKENYTEKGWKKINNLQMNYDIVYSNYPIRECMDVGTVRWYEETE